MISSLSKHLYHPVKCSNKNVQGGFFYWFRPKSVGDGKIPTKKVKVKVSHRENLSF